MYLTQIKAIIYTQITEVVEEETVNKYSGECYPTASSINEVNQSIDNGKFLVNKPKGGFNSPYNKTRLFDVDIETNTLVHLETMIDEFLKISSAYPGGYIFETATYPIWIVVKHLIGEQDYMIAENGFRATMEFEVTWAI